MAAKTVTRHAVAPVRPVPIREAAPRYHVNQATLRRMIARGEITGYRFGQRMVRVDLAELDALLSPIPTAGGPDAT
jgi:excisionase family DNA binding protein